MTIRGLHLHIDGAAGAAGDMTLGALLDLGVPEDVIRDAMQAMGLTADRLQVTPTKKRGISAIDVKIDVGEGHADGQHHHPHYPYADIRARLDAAPLSAGAKRRASDIFDRIARAEASIHGTTIEAVVFHEVGAIDSIADVVGSAAGLEWLNPSSVSATPVATGKGTVGSAHGRLPVPSPAALAIAIDASMPIWDGGEERELLTPTGAAILAHVVTEWGTTPVYTPVAVGYGAGDIDLESRANVLRVAVGHRSDTPSRVREIAANIDDMPGELRAYVAERLLAAGALDTWWTPIFMKKGRPAYRLGVLCNESQVAELCDVVFRETTTIGLRHFAVARSVAEREQVVVQTRFGKLPVKEARHGGDIVNAAPEYEPCREAALAHGVALKEVYEEARIAYRKLRESTEK